MSKKCKCEETMKDKKPQHPDGKFAGKKDGHYKGEMGNKYEHSFGKPKK